MPDFVNFSRWIQRLGFTQPEAPGYAYAVQPVALVRDETEVVNPTPGSRAYAGAFRVAAAGDFLGGHLRNLSAGWVAGSFLYGGSTTAWDSRIVNLGAETAFVGSTAVNKIDENPAIPTIALVGVGDANAAITGARLPATPGTTSFSRFDFWLRPGAVFEAHQVTANQGANILFQWLEFPPELAPSS